MWVQITDRHRIVWINLHRADAVEVANDEADIKIGDHSYNTKSADEIEKLQKILAAAEQQ